MEFHAIIKEIGSDTFPFGSSFIEIDGEFAHCKFQNFVI